MIRMLDDGQHPQACFVAHSLGTTAVSWMLHDPVGEGKIRKLKKRLGEMYEESVVETEGGNGRK